MHLTEQAFQDAAAGAIAEVEAVSSAELVLVVADRCDGYRDLALGTGVAAALAAMLFAIYSPWSFSPGAALAEATLVGGLVTWLAYRSPRVLGWLLSRDRRGRAVARAARAAFHDECLTGTRDRTGILFYYAVLEDRLLVLPDSGVLATVGEAPFHVLEAGFTRGEGTAAERLLRAITGAAEPLKGPLPRAEDDQDELSNLPRLHRFAG